MKSQKIAINRGNFEQVYFKERLYFLYALLIEGNESFYLFGIRDGKFLKIFDIREQPFYSKIKANFKRENLKESLKIIKKYIKDSQLSVSDLTLVSEINY